MHDSHTCQKEGEIAEIKQMLKSLDNHTQRAYDNWHDIKILEEKQELYNQQHNETLAMIKEINECQNEMIKEIVKINTTFRTLKYALAVILTLFGGVNCFLITELIKLI